MKKLLLLIIGVLIVLPTFAQYFEYTYEGQTLIYTILDEDAKTCSVRQSVTTGGNVIIPSIAKDGDIEYSVTEIDMHAFYGCSGLTSVKIPNSITEISAYAFRC